MGMVPPSEKAVLVTRTRPLYTAKSSCGGLTRGMSEVEQRVEEGRLLMGPGPSNVSARVLRAMSRPLVGHLDPEFLKIMNEMQDLLRRCFRPAILLPFHYQEPALRGWRLPLSILWRKETLFW